MTVKVVGYSFLLTLGILFCVCGVNAALKMYFVEDICSYRNTHNFDLRYQKSGILLSVPPMQHQKDFRCNITFTPRHGYSVVLSIYAYDLESDDALLIEDADGHKMALVGSARFPDEKKSIISEGTARLYYVMNNVEKYYYSTRGFQFTFTEVHDAPCFQGEFQCKNDKCISEDLLCKGHNHCGDNSDNKKCVLVQEEIVVDHRASPRAKFGSVWITSIGIAASILFIIIVVFFVILYRRKAGKNIIPKPANSETTVGGNNNIPSVSAGVPSNNQAGVPSNHQTNVPSNPDANVPSNHQANVPNNHQANVPNNHQANVPNNRQAAAQSSCQAGVPSNRNTSDVGFGGPRPSMFSQIRRSFHGLRGPKANEIAMEQTQTESYQVPSMYPSLDGIDQAPSAPSFDGIDNPEFKIEE